MPDDDQPDAVDQIRTADEVARRSLVLHGIWAAGHKEPRPEIVSWLRREVLWADVTPIESDFLLSETPTQQQFIRATWRVEALFPLLWALQLILELPAPLNICDSHLVKSALPPLLAPVGGFISSAKLRPDAEILEANDEIYDIHSRVRNYQRRNEPTPPGKLPRMPVRHRDPPPESFNAGVVLERHHALNWLIGYCNQDWDDITTDT